MSNREENMECLFDELAAVFRERLKDPKCPPAVLSAIVKFLQNNEITALPTEDSALGELQGAIPEHLWKRIETQGNS